MSPRRSRNTVPPSPVASAVIAIQNSIENHFPLKKLTRKCRQSITTKWKNRNWNAMAHTSLKLVRTIHSVAAFFPSPKCGHWLCTYGRIVTSAYHRRDYSICHCATSSSSIRYSTLFHFNGKRHEQKRGEKNDRRVAKRTQKFVNRLREMANAERARARSHTHQFRSRQIIAISFLGCAFIRCRGFFYLLLLRIFFPAFS